MFGYIKPFKPELKLSEYDIYKGAYCGLCKQLGISYGPFARMTLSYDFTFLAMLQMAMSEEKFEFSKQRCAVNPLKKTFCFHASDGLDFSAGVAMILFFYKIKDNLQDDHGLKKIPSYLLYPFASYAYKRAVLNYANVDTIVSSTMSLQKKLEDDGCKSVDKACEPTALSLGRIFELLSEDTAQKRVLYRLGYLMGRFIYMCDALDDIEDDIKNKSYNPFILNYQLNANDTEKILAIEGEAIPSLNLTIAEIGATFELLTLEKYQPILENVIFLGLKAAVHEIGLKRKKRLQQQ